MSRLRCRRAPRRSFLALLAGLSDDLPTMCCDDGELCDACGADGTQVELTAV